MSGVNEIYSLRKSFSIIGLTGRMSTGCSQVATILAQTKTDFISNKNRSYRSIEKIKPGVEKFNEHLFKRKYSIIYNYVEKNWLSYQVIDYKKVIFLFMLDCIKNNSNPEEEFYKLMEQYYCKSIKGLDNDLTGEFKLDRNKLKKELKDNKFSQLILDLKKLSVDIKEINSKDDLDLLHKIYFNSSLNKLYDGIIHLMKKNNQYITIFFFHKLGTNIRKTGSVYSDEIESTEHVYTVVKLINRIIKSYKRQDINKKNCHIVIDSFKSSLEIMFFKERYSAFYIVSIHNDEGYEKRIEKKILHSNHKQITKDKIVDLDNIEYDSSSFGKGKFYAPDVQNCIQKSEIHLEFIEKIENKFDFHTVTEQLMKVQALIQQPGIITPTNVERCMQIAFNSKFNSGCISRQVGAVITDASFSIKSVGWNDTPKNTIACLFRNVNEIKDVINDLAYSEFEQKNSKYKYVKNLATGVDEKGEKVDIILNAEYVGKNFASNLVQQLKKRTDKIIDDGKNCSFCFKTYHNKFEGEKNQVHTRSLHAEENAMLQISKHGGQKLTEGNLFTTASPCELCAKKAFQLGIKYVYFIDKYPGISMEHVLKHGVNSPTLIPFKGIIGNSFNKLYEPIMAYKDELNLY